MDKTTLQKTERKIRELVPRLMRENNGCLISPKKDFFHSVLEMSFEAGEIFILLTLTKNSFHFVRCADSNGYDELHLDDRRLWELSIESGVYFLDRFEIIGRPIRLGDILEAFKIFGVSEKLEIAEFIKEWDFSSDFKDQDEGVQLYVADVLGILSDKKFKK